MSIPCVEPKPWPVLTIECSDVGIDWQDAGVWRNYEFSVSGTCLAKLLEDVSISEIDQDGGEIDTYGPDGASNEVADRVEELIAAAFLRWKKEAPREDMFIRV